jgi:hypothetical protein
MLTLRFLTTHFVKQQNLYNGTYESELFFGYVFGSGQNFRILIHNTAGYPVSDKISIRCIPIQNIGCGSRTGWLASFRVKRLKKPRANVNFFKYKVNAFTLERYRYRKQRRHFRQFGAGAATHRLTHYLISVLKVAFIFIFCRYRYRTGNTGTYTFTFLWYSRNK